MITFTANIRSASAATDDAITTSSVGIPITLNLSTDFDGLAKTLCFKTPTASVDIALVGDATESVVPPDVLVKQGEWLNIGIYAADESGNIVIPTVWANAGIIQLGTLPSGVDPSAPTPSWVAQVQNIASEAIQNSEQAIETANDAKEAAITAQDSAQASASAAAQSAADAAQKASEAAQSATQAANSASSASTSATAAGMAQTGAETAQTAAETAAQSVSASADQIQKNADDITDLKSAISDSTYYKKIVTSEYDNEKMYLPLDGLEVGKPFTVYAPSVSDGSVSTYFCSANKSAAYGVTLTFSGHYATTTLTSSYAYLRLNAIDANDVSWIVKQTGGLQKQINDLQTNVNAIDLDVDQFNLLKDGYNYLGHTIDARHVNTSTEYDIPVMPNTTYLILMSNAKSNGTAVIRPRANDHSYITSLSYSLIRDEQKAVKLTTDNDTYYLRVGGTGTTDYDIYVSTIIIDKYKFNVKEYGAVGDGITNDSYIIQSLLNKASTDGNVCIYFPRGTYYIGTTLSYYPNTEIIMHPEAIILRDATVSPILTNSSICGDDVPCYSNGYLRIKGGTFKGVYPSGDTVYRLVGLQCGKLSELTVENVSFIDACAGNHLIDISGCNNVTIRHNKIIGMHLQQSLRPITPDGDEGHVAALEMIQLDVGEGLGVGKNPPYDLIPTKNVVIEDNEFMANPDNTESVLYRPIGIHMNPYEGYYYEKIRINNNSFKDILGRCIGISGVRQVEICRNTFSSDLSMIDDLIKLSMRMGMSANDSTNIKIEDNVCGMESNTYQFFRVYTGGSSAKYMSYIRLIQNIASDLGIVLENTNHAYILQNSVSNIDYSTRCSDVVVN